MYAVCGRVVYCPRHFGNELDHKSAGYTVHCFKHGDGHASSAIAGIGENASICTPTPVGWWQLWGSYYASEATSWREGT